MEKLLKKQHFHRENGPQNEKFFALNFNGLDNDFHRGFGR